MNGNGGSISNSQGPMSYGHYASPAPMTVNVPGRETVSAALDSHQDHIIGLHKSLAELEARLALVLDPVPGNVDASAPAPTPQSVLHRVQYASNGVVAAQSRINDLLTRINL